jgi:hypothetical protein
MGDEMRRKVMVGMLALTLTACNQTGSYSNYMSNYYAQESARKASALPAQQTRLAAVKSGSLPKDYKKTVDTKFASTLIDPDSRKIEFTSIPYGGLVCGTVNAKNRMGGYTGKNPFYAVFNEKKELTDLESFSDKDLGTANNVGDPGEIMHVSKTLLKDCKFI